MRFASVLLFLAACGSNFATGDSQNVTEETIPTPIIAPPVAGEAGQRQTYDAVSQEANFTLWSQFCDGDKDVTQRPAPKLSNPAVAKAAANLSRVASHSFALYSGIKKHHTSVVPADAGITQEAWDFLAYTCGEFRDRATMVEAKVTYFGELFNYLQDAQGPVEFDTQKSPWSQMLASDYEPYLALSRGVFRAKEEARESAKLSIGAVTADTPVPPYTVCETKYMFAEYIRKGKQFDDDYTTYKAGLERFACSDEDRQYYYDFRGDSNAKPNSPESNGMIWFSQMMTNQCDPASTYQAVNSGSTLTAEHCRRYFKYPFASRWNAARAGLAAWVMTDPFAAGQSSSSAFKVSPKSVTDASYVFGDKSPYAALGVGDTPFALLPGWEAHFADATFGLTTLFGGDPEKLQRILQIAVDRHTDWYASKWDDLMTVKNNKKDQAYSPFVASSYEMGESNGFTSPGVTVQSNDPTAGQYKHWMFVFRVKASNWFTPERVLAGEAMDFDRMWLDETSFGDSGLANRERAWDRLGTPLEPELLGGAALYLRNIPR